jgi:hypothetical protein
VAVAVEVEVEEVAVAAAEVVGAEEAEEAAVPPRS